jgi:hypothetical protein
MTARELLADCSALGVAATPGPGDTLEWEAEAGRSGALLEALAARKWEMLALLVCPGCRGPFEVRGHRWKCRGRVSSFGWPTGSAFIELCCLCGQKN